MSQNDQIFVPKSPTCIDSSTGILVGATASAKVKFDAGEKGVGILVENTLHLGAIFHEDHVRETRKEGRRRRRKRRRIRRISEKVGDFTRPRRDGRNQQRERRVRLEVRVCVGLRGG